MQVVDQTKQSNEERFDIQFHPFGILDGLTAHNADREKTVAKLLDNIAKQTSLKFRVETAEVTLWFVKRAGKS